VAAVEQLTDLLVTIGRRTHGINVYTLQQGDAGSITVPDRVAARLQRWAKDNRVTLHMLVADRRQVLPRVTYRYRRGLRSIPDVDRLAEVTPATLRGKL
jgi:hypothetical protein